MGRGLKTQDRCSKAGGWEVGMRNKIPRITLQRQGMSFLGMTRVGKEVTPKGLGRDPKNLPDIPHSDCFGLERTILVLDL